MKYTYQAFDHLGKVARGTVEAQSPADASEVLRRQGLFASELKPVTPGDPLTAPRAGARVGSSLRLKLLSGFAHQASVLISTGTPVVETIGAIERQTSHAAWRSVLADVRSRVEQGESLAAAMQAHPQFFDTVACSLVSAGESGGKLDIMLARLARLTRQQLKVRNTVIGAMVYPALLLVVAVGVLTTMLGFVMPRFEGLFLTLDVPLPASTRLLMGVSKALTAYWWAFAGVGALGVVVLVLALRSAAGKAWLDGVLMSSPQVGAMARGLVTARIARVLGVLLEGKVPLLDSLRLTKAAAGSRKFEQLLERAEAGVTRGENMSAVLASSPLMSPSVIEAIRSGERSGQLAPVLLMVADALDEDNEVVVKTLTSILEPVILIVLGLVVGAVAISMFLPLFDLTAGTAPGGGA
jgi:type IV pilus assembly protein PilC